MHLLKNKLLAFIALSLSVLLLCGCGKTVTLPNGKFPLETEELSTVLTAEELPLLDSFTGLKAVDLSGSSCYAEILAWAQAHPDVAVRYTVSLPGGLTVDWDTAELTLDSVTGAEAAGTAALLPYLPALKTIDLGSEASGASLTGADIALIRQAAPEAYVRYSFSLAGQSVSLEDTSLELPALSHEEAAKAADLLSCLPALTYVDLGSQGENSLTWEDIGALQAARPETDFAYGFTLYGKSLSTLDETLDFNHITMDDRGAAVRAILPYMQKCTFLDMDFCGVSNEDMASIRDEFPNIKVVWRVWFGSTYSVRTDVEKILASKPSVGGLVYDQEADILKYCTDVKYLDLGHNECITDISFTACMPNLEVFVIAMNPITDLTPLMNCPHLEYLELNSTEISDLSPLSGLTELRHLNIGNCQNISDISPLYGLTELERLWIGCIDPVPDEQVAAMQAAAPNCEIDTETYDPTEGGWRYTGLTERAKAIFAETGWIELALHPRYELLREQFGYADSAYSFYWLDPLYDPHN